MAAIGHVHQFPDATHPAICAREVKPNVFRTVPTWLSTVRSEMNRRAPISRLVSPSATSCATCVPRRLSAPECPGFLTASAVAGAVSRSASRDAICRVSCCPLAKSAAKLADPSAAVAVLVALSSARASPRWTHPQKTCDGVSVGGPV